MTGTYYKKKDTISDEVKHTEIASIFPNKDKRMITQKFDLAQNGKITIKRTVGQKAGVKVQFNIKTEWTKKGRHKRSVYLYYEDKQRWSKFGVVVDGKIVLSHTKRTDKCSKLYREILNDPTRFNGFEYAHKAHCMRCNRELTDQMSIWRGYGPECKKYI